jgi:hypothetical protein
MTTKALWPLIAAYHRRATGKPYDENDIQYLKHFRENRELLIEAGLELSRLEAFDSALGGKLHMRDHDQSVALASLRVMLNEYEGMIEYERRIGAGTTVPRPKPTGKKRPASGGPVRRTHRKKRPDAGRGSGSQPQSDPGG